MRPSTIGDLDAQIAWWRARLAETESDWMRHSASGDEVRAQGSETMARLLADRISRLQDRQSGNTQH